MIRSVITAVIIYLTTAVVSTAAFVWRKDSPARLLQPLVPPLAQVRRRAGREMIINKSITVYDGAGLNRRRPRFANPFDALTVAFIDMRKAVQGQLFAELNDVAKTFARFADAMPKDLPKHIQPWWFCCGWWSPWCVLDTFGHWLFPASDDNGIDSLPGPLGWICDRHDAAIIREFDR